MPTHNIKNRGDIQMGFVIGILFLVISAVLAAADGDWSGIEFILQVVVGVGMFFLMAVLLLSC